MIHDAVSRLECARLVEKEGATASPRDSGRAMQVSEIPAGSATRLPSYCPRM